MADQISFLANLPVNDAVMRLRYLHQPGNLGQWLFDLPRTVVKIVENSDGSIQFHLSRRIGHIWTIATIRGQLYPFHQGATQVEAICPLFTTVVWLVLVWVLILFALILYMSSGCFLILLVLNSLYFSVRVSMARNHLIRQFRKALE